MLARGIAAHAASPDVLVPGWDLPANIDPHQVLDVPAENVAFNLYDNLYRYEDNPPKIEPWLAESHTVSPDGLTWEFKLRPGAKFHDGSPVTAADVVFSFQRVLKIGKAPAAPFLPVLKPDGITAPDPQTVRIRLEKPYGPFFAAVPMVMIVNEKLVRAHDKDGDWGAAWLASNEAGSGAYRLIPETYVPLEKVDMERNEAHFMGWSHNPNPIRRVEIRPTQETSTRVLALLNGSLDLTDTYLPVDQVENIEKSTVGACHPQPDHAHLPDPHEQHQAALRQRQRPQMLRARLQLCRLHRRDPERQRAARPDAAAQHDLGISEGCCGLRIRSEEGQRILPEGGRRGRADEAPDRDPHPAATGADDAGGAGVPGRSRDPRHQSEDRRRHLSRT